MIKKLLTIVVPVYKVEPYINKCLDSCVLADERLMNQLEVIIVNDGTPDRSAEMSREYVKRYPQTFRQIDKENGGHGSAWNVGLKEATGRYLRFLDSDDWLTNLDKLMEKLAQTDADLVFTDECVHYINEGCVETLTCSILYEKYISLDDTNFTNFIKDYKAINFMRCTYKTIILKKQYPLFREHVSYDDTILYAAPYLYAKSMVAYSFVVYHLLRGRDEQSMNSKVIRSKAEHYVMAYCDLHDYVCSHDFSPIVFPKIKEAELAAYSFALSIILGLEYSRRKKLIKVLQKNCPNDYQGGKSYRRYEKWPFIFAYIWDSLRHVKNNI